MFLSVKDLLAEIVTNITRIILDLDAILSFPAAKARIVSTWK